MIIINHHQGKKLAGIFRDKKELSGFSGKLIPVFWQVCQEFPEDLIIWKEQDLQADLSRLDEIFTNEQVMASYPIQSYYISDEIGYVDQLPFVNPNRDVRYPTWRMSADIGGIYGKTALKFKAVFEDMDNFGYLLNSIAKAGQQNSLFCYSDPAFIEDFSRPKELKSRNIAALFSFVGQHYKKVRLLVLFFCFLKYEKKIPFVSFLKAALKRSFFRVNVDLSETEFQEIHHDSNSEAIDVIIPTLGRPEHLKNVLIDLKNQQKKPEKVIIVEQNPEPNSSSDLNCLKTEEWPFKIIHHFIHKTGASNARNMALKGVTSDFVFFADDDIRFQDDLIEKAFSEMKKFNISALNLNTLQPGEKTEFSKIKQWGAFASGASIVRSEFAKKADFSLAFEHGFGEDYDYGMKLRKLGCDVIYHPGVILQHLKAESGGFREVMKTSDTNAEVKPKPSPTFMLLIQKHYNRFMQGGYKVNLFLKFYQKQATKNPFSYISMMKKRWKVSEQKSMELNQQSENINR